MLFRSPSRILAKTIDFANMEKQPAEPQGDHFSFWGDLNRTLPLPRTRQREMPCYMVYTNQQTAEIVRANLSEAPLYQGKIEGRYYTINAVNPQRSQGLFKYSITASFGMR